MHDELHTTTMYALGRTYQTGASNQHLRARWSTGRNVYASVETTYWEESTTGQQ
jgi:hypothetical protein